MVDQIGGQVLVGPSQTARPRAKHPQQDDSPSQKAAGGVWEKRCFSPKRRKVSKVNMQISIFFSQAM